MELTNLYKIHEFAELSGVTVKALHHYDRLGLLKPQRTASGYRLYSERDLERLEQIVALKFLGFPLKQIKAVLGRAALELPEALRVQRRILAEKQALLARAMSAIQKAEEALESGKPAGLAILKQLIEGINMQNDAVGMKKYFSEEAWVKLQSNRTEELSQDWRDLYGDVEAALDEDPGSDKAQALAARWMELSGRTSGGDAEVRQGMMNSWADHGNWPAELKQGSTIIHPEKIAAFIAKANSAHRKKYYSDEAWAKINERSTEEEARLGVAWHRLFLEVDAALGEDPGSDRAQALCARWTELAEQSMGDSADLKEGAMKAWADRENWPAMLQPQSATYRREEVVEFIKRAYVERAKKAYIAEHWGQLQ
jgi:MerR family transcriptional regulator, thiopeptide resistance regulator